MAVSTWVWSKIQEPKICSTRYFLEGGVTTWTIMSSNSPGLLSNQAKGARLALGFV